MAQLRFILERSRAHTHTSILVCLICLCLRQNDDFIREDFDIYTESQISVFDSILGTSIKADVEPLATLPILLGASSHAGENN